MIAIKSGIKRKKNRTDIYTDIEVSIMNKTSRVAGVVGKNAIIPRVVRDLATSSDLILDFGACKTARHARELISEGFRVVAYDIGSNFDPELHDYNALNRKYTIVYASNVLNVQPSPAHVISLVDLWASLLGRNGILVVNYPISPRYSSLGLRDIENILESKFNLVYKDRRFSSPVFICSK